ncbi:hypothetical protein RB653_004422 [Dictyostelium firmibasis]|uniref:DUF4460 domain-containing protein n=1 Tax=Dictyostelium firmibasis TaxID=79012 RepID=A0AAN7TZG4_9MYCE
MIRGLYKSFSKPSLSIGSFTNEKSKSFLKIAVSQTSRNYCTKSEDKPKLRHILKKFYLMIHPDTLTEHPHEKNVNSHNMKVFMSVFDQYKKRPTADPNIKPVVHNLSFYVPEEKLAGGEAPKTSKDRKFKVVDVELIQNSNNPNHIPNQIRLLFEKCKLPTNFITEIETIDNVKQPSINGSLREFLLDNKHYVSQKLVISEKQKSELDTMVRKIKRELKVNVQMTTDPLDSSFTYQENYHALLHFQDVIKQWKEKVEQEAKDGSELVTSGKLKYDLNHTEVNFTSSDPICYFDRSSPETWVEYLNCLNLSVLNQEVLEEKKEMEIKTKQFTKERVEFYTHIPVLEKILKCRSLRYVEHDDPSEDPKLYLNPMEQMTQVLNLTSMLMKNKSELENLMKTRFKKYKFGINISIVPNLHKNKFCIDIDGTLKINPNVTFNEFCDILENQHKNAFEHSKLADKYESIRDYAKVRMGLRHLTCLSSFAYNHGSQKVFDAYQKLYDSADRLRDIGLSGFILIIGDYYSVSKSGEIVLKYDFNTEDLIKQLSASSKDVEYEEVIENNINNNNNNNNNNNQKEKDINIDLTNISSVLEQYENQNKSFNKTL